MVVKYTKAGFRGLLDGASVRVVSISLFDLEKHNFNGVTLENGATKMAAIGHIFGLYLSNSPSY